LVISGGFAVLGFFPIHQQVLFIFLSVIISILGFVLLLVLSVLRKAVHRLFTFQSIILLGAFVCSIVFFRF
jgi:lysylphosphatidylglycerol synthetase-like protein (DUF2156 family)